MQKPILEVKGLKKYFDIQGGVFGKIVGEVKAVDGVSFSVNPGEILGIVGVSGCGKSTTGKAILRLVEPIEVEIIFDGRDITQLHDEEILKLRRDKKINTHITSS